MPVRDQSGGAKPAATAGSRRGHRSRTSSSSARTTGDASPEYFLFDPESGILEGFRLVTGRYEPLLRDAAGRLASEQLVLPLGVFDGEVRLHARDGRLILLGGALERIRSGAFGGSTSTSRARGTAAHCGSTTTCA
jgi:hypothetical protein